MAIKKLTVSFDLPIPVFLSMLAAGNSGMKIDVFGDDSPAKTRKLLNGANPQALLEAPKSSRTGTRNARGRDASGKLVTSYRTIWDAIVAAGADKNISTRDLRLLMPRIGLSEKSVSPQITKLRVDGYVRKMDNGVYRITARGLADHAKLLKAEAEQSHA
jgi:hypothetical protein